MKYLFTLLFSAAVFICNAQAPQRYTDFYGGEYNLYKWEGRKIVLLTQTNALDHNVMSRWLNKLDEAYEYYEAATGREPFQWHLTYLNGRATIAFVDSTCGAGCGYLGSTGIEIMQIYFNELYNQTVNNEYNHIPFYELGRNFWFYGPNLSYKEIPNVYDPVATGFAVVMRFMSMEYTGAAGAPFGDEPFEVFKGKVKNILTTYLNNPSLTWYNTLAENKGVPDYRGAPDLFASFCLYLADNYGGQNWVQKVWKFAGLRPAATTTQDAVDNFIIASSQAANQNLTALFLSWKWPVSDAAKNELQIMFSVLPVKFSSFSIERNCEKVVFIWATVMESTNKGFELQESYDGINFTTVGFKAGTNTTTNHTYTYEYIPSTTSVLYCRIKQVDYDGQFVYSDIVKVSTTCKTSLSIYPNPVSRSLNIKGLNRKSVLKLFNTSGVLLQHWNAQPVIDLSDYAAGIYFLIIDDDEVHKLIKL